MTKRKFSSKRLYKLVRLIVIIVSVLAGISAFLQYRVLTKYESELKELIKNSDLPRDDVQITEKEYDELFMAELQGKITDKSKQEMEKYRKFKLNEEEIHFSITYQTEMSNRISLSSIVAIGLPILFFAGVGIYRYLFHVLGFDERKAKK